MLNIITCRGKKIGSDEYVEGDFRYLPSYRKVMCGTIESRYLIYGREHDDDWGGYDEFKIDPSTLEISFCENDWHKIDEVRGIINMFESTRFK